MPPRKAPRTRTTPATTTNTTSVTNSQLQEMIDQGVTATLATRDANRSTNGDDSHIRERSIFSSVRRLTRIARIEKYVGGLPGMIHGSVMASTPKTMHDDIEMAIELMDKKTSTLVERQVENKKEYARTLPLCNRCKLHHNGPCTTGSDCTRDKEPNHGNQAKGTQGARGLVACIRRGEVRFGKRGKLNPRYVGPSKVMEKVGSVAYKLELPQELSRVHHTFHVSNLKKCYTDEPLAVLFNGFHIENKLYFIEEPAEIMDQKVKRLKQSRIEVLGKSQIELFFVYKDPIIESQDMLTSTTHQQSLADGGSETRPRCFKEAVIYHGQVISEGSQTPTLQTEDDLIGDDLKHYEAEIEAMNLILISIPNDIYNSVNACTTAQALWQRVERLMRGIVQNKVDRETRFNNEFDQFVAEPGEALVSVYNHFAQLINVLELIGIKFPRVIVNTNFLNCLQPEWLKYVTQVRLAKRLTEDSYDD
ncbi:hypothetical protein Tco_0783982, partial [Tanacetum coccineum]